MLARPKSEIVILNKRETECINHLACGRNAKEIARLLKLSPRTVATHIANLKTKLGCYKKSELVTLWLKNKEPFIVSPPIPFMRFSL